MYNIYMIRTFDSFDNPMPWSYFIPLNKTRGEMYLDPFILYHLILEGRINCKTIFGCISVAMG